VTEQGSDSMIEITRLLPIVGIVVIMVLIIGLLAMAITGKVELNKESFKLIALTALVIMITGMIAGVIVIVLGKM